MLGNAACCPRASFLSGKSQHFLRFLVSTDRVILVVKKDEGHKPFLGELQNLWEMFIPVVLRPRSCSEITEVQLFSTKTRAGRQVTVLMDSALGSVRAVSIVPSPALLRWLPPSQQGQPGGHVLQLPVCHKTWQKPGAVLINSTAPGSKWSCDKSCSAVRSGAGNL